MFLDNKSSTSSKGPVDFVKKYYLTKEAKDDLYIIEASIVNHDCKIIKGYEKTDSFDMKG